MSIRHLFKRIELEKESELELKIWGILAHGLYTQSHN